MIVAITGGSGFIGLHILNILNSLGIKTLVVTRTKQRIPTHLDKCTIVEMDIQHPKLIEIEQLKNADVLIHLAWGGLPNYYSLHHFENELPIHYSFLKTLIKSGLKTLVVTGTCFEYGNQSGLLFEDQQCLPNNPYGFAKNTLRCQMEYLQKKESFSLTWARLFYLYGEGQSNHSLYQQLKNAVESKQTTFNMSGGEQLRDFLPVEVVARYLVSLAIMQINGGTVNICSGKPISIRNLVERWIRENNWNIRLNLGFFPYNDYEPMAFWGSNYKLLTILEKNEKNQRLIYS